MAHRDRGRQFAIDAPMRVAASDRVGSDRLLRHCNQPVCALERVRKFNADEPACASTKVNPARLARRA
jgi:hypothetical protein